MGTLSFDDELRTGHAVIDEQHEALFQLAQRVIDKLGTCSLDSHTIPSPEPDSCEERVEDALADAVYGLVDYTTEHFSDEETVMREAGYPSAPIHSALHAELAERVTAYMVRLMDGDEVCAAELVDFLIEWLTAHIMTSDREFTAWLSAQGR